MSAGSAGEALLRDLALYEAEAQVPERERLAEASAGRARVRPGADEALALEAAALSGGFLEFCDEVDEMADMYDPEDPRGPYGVPGYARDRVTLSARTPSALLRAGLDDLPIRMTAAKLWRAMAPEGVGHALPVELVKRIPIALMRSAMVADGPYRGDRLLVVLAEATPDGLPVVVPIQPRAGGAVEVDGVATNLILTAFGRRNFLRCFGGAVTPDMVVFIDSSAERSLASKIGQEPFGGLPGVRRNAVLRRPSCLAAAPSFQERIDAAAAGFRGPGGEAQAGKGMHI